MANRTQKRGIIFLVIGIVCLVIYFITYNNIRLGSIVEAALVGFGLILTLGGIYYIIKGKK